MAWTNQMVEQLRVLWQEGLTTSEIAKRLGVSKNSIVGKIHRLKLPGRPSPIKKEEKDTKTPAKKLFEKVKEKFSKKTKDAPDIEPEKPVTTQVEVEVAIPETVSVMPTPEVQEEREAEVLVKLTDLDNHTCRWPIGDPKDENFHFCGKKIKTGQTYCDEHSAIAFVRR